MHRFVLLVSLPLLLHASDLRAQTRKPIGTPEGKTAGQQIPSTEMFSFENCVVKNEYIYWQRGHDQLVRVQREDGKYPQTLITTNTRIGNFALDGNEVYYMTENKNESSGTSSSNPLKGELRKVDLTNGSIKTVFADFDYPADQFIGTDSTHIYFLGGSKEGIVVWRLAKSGGQPERLVSGLKHPLGFVVDEKNVYWCDYGNNSVRKVAKTGGEPIVLLVVADDKYVYWSEWKRGLLKLAK